MNKRYQVFVSSTFEDLKNERQLVIQALLKANHIPAGMELFPASGDEQFKYIKKIIDDCDYYILIVGGRYGQINPNTGLSYTEQEYEYAIEKGLPVLTFVHSEPKSFPTEVVDTENSEHLELFRKRVTGSRLCFFWKTPIELVSAVITSLTFEITSNPMPGWRRGGEDPEALMKRVIEAGERINLLENDIETLRRQLANIKKAESLSYGDDLMQVVGFSTGGSHNQLYKAKFSWDELFSFIGPYLTAPENYVFFARTLKDSINDYLESRNKSRFYSIDSNIIQTIKIQFVSLGYISSYSAEATTGGLMEFLEITTFGTEYLEKIMTIKRKECIDTSAEQENISRSNDS